MAIYNFINVKRLCIVFIIGMSITFMAHAQNYKEIKIGLSTGLTITDFGIYAPATGYFLSFEPSYRITDNLSIGLRFQSAENGFNSEKFTVEQEVVSYTVCSQYYFNDDHFRPFVGVGLGLYKSIRYRENGQVYVFGFYPRFGFEAGHFTMALDYNLISSNKKELVNIENYFCIGIGFFIGGGKKKSSPIMK